MRRPRIFCSSTAILSLAIALLRAQGLEQGGGSVAGASATCGCFFSTDSSEFTFLTDEAIPFTLSATDLQAMPPPYDFQVWGRDSAGSTFRSWGLFTLSTSVIHETHASISFPIAGQYNYVMHYMGSETIPCCPSNILNSL